MTCIQLLSSNKLISAALYLRASDIKMHFRVLFYELNKAILHSLKEQKIETEKLKMDIRMSGIKTEKTPLHFTHANGIPGDSYQKFFGFLKDDFDLKYIPLIGMHPDYPVTHDWRFLVDQVIHDIEHQFSGKKVVGLGHSFGSLLTLMCAYKRPELFSQLVIMDPPFVVSKKSILLQCAQKLKLKAVDKLTPAGITLKRTDFWESKEQAYRSMRNNSLFRNFDETCFQDFIQSGLVPAQSGDGVTLRIPKNMEAEIFRTVPAWWWRTPGKAPVPPVHLITADSSPFYKQGFPQNVQKIYKIDYSLVKGGHMFPLEQPEKTALLVKNIIEMQRAE